MSVIKNGDLFDLTREDGVVLARLEWIEKPTETISGGSMYVWRLKVVSGLDQDYVFLSEASGDFMYVQGFEGRYRLFGA